MRGTGSHTVELRDVFVPAASVSLKRPKNKWHAAWDIALGVAPPLYMAAYVGLAESASEQALAHARKKASSASTQLALGELENALASAQLAWRDMVERCGDLDFALGSSTPTPSWLERRW
jgi:alkylation response protein AidB-like acyl-CoA dehydrogenase